MPMNNLDDLINPLMNDVTGQNFDDDGVVVSKDKINETIANILNEYGLKTDMSFIEKMAKLKLPAKSGDKFDLEELPSELRDAAFLPVDTVADIALRQDLDLVISQIPEWFTALQITRDAICEADVVDGTMARDIKFDRRNLEDNEIDNIISKVEEVEDRLELHSIIKNHVVFNTLEYGEGYVYCIPYAKVFSDLYKYRLSNKSNGDNSALNYSTMDTSSILHGFGYGESAVEVSLTDTVINDSTNKSMYKKNKQGIYTESVVFSESEIMEVEPMFHAKVFNEDMSENKQLTQESDQRIIDGINHITDNIRYIEKDIALPVIEESAHDLRIVYKTKYHDEEGFVQEVNNIFKKVMNEAIYMEDGEENKDDDFDGTSYGKDFENVKGVYLKILPATKLIPIRVDRNIIGYYYISDMTRPEEAGQRKNSGLTGYTLRSPSVGYDTFSPDRMFCEKLASKIINNFNLKFMRDNIALHEQIVAILEAHKFNDSMLRFIFIPAEHVIQCTINKDGIGKGHSMLEPGLVTARMYMFLKLYSILYQINNSTVRVYNINMSGLDKNYQDIINEAMRKFAARRVTVNDIFNYRSSITKVSGYSELMMPMGAGDKPPVTFETIPAAEAPINNDLLEKLKNESINSTPVPSLMVQTGGESQIEFAKETELANTRFNTMISSYKIDLNRDITRLYRKILRWETDIDPSILKNLKYILRMPAAKTLGVTVEMVNNFNSLLEVLVDTFLRADEVKDKDGNPTEMVRQFKKLVLHEYIPQIDIDHFDDLVDQARDATNTLNLAETNKAENIIDSGLEEAPEEAF
jgi:hypothetical protein